MIPNYLYHYTSLEVLILILKEGKIRFKRLDKVNDPTEGNIPEFPELGRYVFISSWTAQKRDEIPMWSLYSNFDGVRIRMPVDLFNHKDEMTLSKRKYTSDFEIVSKLDKCYLIETEKKARFAKHSGNYYEIDSVVGPSIVEYTSNPKDIVNDAIVISTHSSGKQMYYFKIGSLGQRKVDFWSFEKEFRFRIILDRLTVGAKPEIIKSTFDNILNEHIDICYTKRSLEGIEILLGPKSKDSDEMKIKETLIEQGIKDFTIKKSTIKIK